MISPGRVVADAFLSTARGEDVPSTDGWLTLEERSVMASLMVPKRRQDWRLGRWVAHRAARWAMARAGTEVPTLVSVLAADDGAPELVSHGVRLPVAISISHSGGVGFAAAVVGDPALGCDVERVEPRSDRFIADYLTPTEQDFVARTGHRGAANAALAATLVWSAKESALKATRQGLRADTRSVELDTSRVTPPLGGPGETWRPLAVRTEAGDRWTGKWRVEEGFVWTILSNLPLRLR